MQLYEMIMDNFCVLSKLENIVKYVVVCWDIAFSVLQYLQ